MIQKPANRKLKLITVSYTHLDVYKRQEQAIVSIGRKEIQKMIEDGETIEVKCHFCNSAYHYTVEDLKAIIKRSK